MEVHRGEVFYADLSPVVGSEQGGIRPVLIIQNEIGNRHSPTVIAAAITSRQDKNRLPTHISVRADRCGLAKDSIILTEQIRTLDKRRLRERAGRIPEDDMRRVDEALGVSMGLESQSIHPDGGYFGCTGSSSSTLTGTPRCSTGVENTICVRVRPNCCKWLMNWSNSCVVANSTSISIL